MTLFPAQPSRRQIIAGLAFSAAWPARQSFAQASPWADGLQSRARLVGAGGLEEGRYLAGVEITLQPRFMTYWRMPGDAGLAPSFQFTGSKNLKSAQVLYPAPNRYQLKNEEAFGYRTSVTFPIRVEPLDPAAPVTLVLKLDYATCEEICIPAQALMSLELRPAPTSTSPAQAQLRHWLSLVPAPWTGTLSMTRQDAKSWLIGAPMEGVLDLFAEGPTDFYFETRPQGTGFLMRLIERPAQGSAQVPVLFTIVGEKAAYEAQASLDLSGTTP